MPHDAAAQARAAAPPAQGASSGQRLGADQWIAGHLRRLVRIALILQICAFAFFIAGTHGAFGPLPEPPTTTDFASFYTAGRLANLGRAGASYDPTLHVAVERTVVGPGVEEKRFLNPPPFLLICAPLARLPYLAAFLLFEALTGALWLLLATRIAGGGVLASACLASVPAVWWALGWGQNSFVSAALMAGGTLLLRTRPLLAGAAFGALCFKPHFGVLIPVALLAGRHWRAILGAAVSALSLSALSLALFGRSCWAAFFTMFGHARGAIETGIQLSGHVDLAGAARLAGLPADWGWALQAAAASAAAASVAWSWSGRRAKAARADPAAAATANAVLVAGTLTAMPFVLFYDLVMAAVAAAWLVRAARLRAWRSGEPAGLAAAWALGLLAYPAAASAHMALGAATAPLLLWMAIRRQRAGRTESKF